MSAPPPPPPPYPVRGEARGRMRRGPMLAVFAGVLVLVLGATAVVVFALQAPDPEPPCPPERAPCGAPPTEPGLPTPGATATPSPEPTTGSTTAGTPQPTTGPTTGSPEPTTGPTTSGSPEPTTGPPPSPSPEPTASPTPTEPPSVPELRAGQVYRSELGFEVEFNPGLWQVARQSSRELDLVIRLSGFDVFLTIQGVPAREATPKQLLDRRLGELDDDILGLAKDTDPDLEILGPSVGYRSGVGGLFAGNVDTPQGPGDPLTVVVMAATDHRATVVMSLVASERSAPIAAVFAEGDRVMNTFRFPSEVHS